MHAFCSSTLLASLVTVTYDDPIDTWQDLLDNNIKLPLFEGEGSHQKLIILDTSFLFVEYWLKVQLYQTDCNMQAKSPSEEFTRNR